MVRAFAAVLIHYSKFGAFFNLSRTKRKYRKKRANKKEAVELVNILSFKWPTFPLRTNGNVPLGHVA
jgi:hypothetical protein